MKVLLSPNAGRRLVKAAEAAPANARVATVDTSEWENFIKYSGWMSTLKWL